jgi:NADPH-dependent 2,4-dienoyl-CoA reductase/sulfur reductase-like enzyme
MWCRLDGAELDVADGITIDDACAAAQLAIDAGLDAVHVSAYADPGIGVAFTRAPLVHEPGGFLDLARAVKDAVAPAPVLAVGRIEPDVGDRLVADGDADFVTMGRRLLADPELPNKLAAGRTDDVRPCIYSYRCVGNVFLTRGARCTVNASTGREHELPIAFEPATSPRHVLVIGGGPAGMETARIAAARGHRVTLLERSAQLGGRARLAAHVEAAVGPFVAWLERQLAAHGVDVQLGCDARDVDVNALGADVVVLATGADVPSCDDDVAGALAAMGPTDELTVFGGNAPAALVAAKLAERDVRVTLVSPHDNFGVGLAPPRLWRTMHALRTFGVTLVVNGELEDDDGNALRFEPWQRGRFDIAAPGGVDVHRVGDCRDVGLLDGAMLDAARVARAL